MDSSGLYNISMIPNYNGNETHRVFGRGEIDNEVGDHKQISIKTFSFWNIMSKLFKIEDIIEICYKLIIYIK